MITIFIFTFLIELIKGQCTNCCPGQSGFFYQSDQAGCSCSWNGYYVPKKN